MFIKNIGKFVSLSFFALGAISVDSFGMWHKKYQVHYKKIKNIRIDVDGIPTVHDISKYKFEHLRIVVDSKQVSETDLQEKHPNHFEAIRELDNSELQNINVDDFQSLLNISDDQIAVFNGEDTQMSLINVQDLPRSLKSMCLTDLQEKRPNHFEAIRELDNSELQNINVDDSQSLLNISDDQIAVFNGEDTQISLINVQDLPRSLKSMCLVDKPNVLQKVLDISANQQTLVVFDCDDVLITKEGTKVRLLNDQIKGIVETLQNKGIKVLVLTGVNNLDWRVNQLRNFGFHFENSWPGVDAFEIINGLGFKEGVVTSGKVYKGTVLKKFLEYLLNRDTPIKFNKVIFIDDCYINVSSVGWIAGLKLFNEFLGVYYREKERIELLKALFKKQKFA